MRISEETLDRARAVDPEQIARALELEPHRSRKNKWRCPFCGSEDGKGDNLQVNPKRTYRRKGDKHAAICWACGIKCPNTIDFVRDFRGFDFVEAVEWICEEAGIPLDHQPYHARRKPGQACAEKESVAQSSSSLTNSEVSREERLQKATDWLMRRMPFDWWQPLVEELRREHAHDRLSLRAQIAYLCLHQIWESLSLSEQAATYLESRAISRDLARKFGVKSISVSEHERIVSIYPAKILEFVGWGPQTRPRRHKLVLPYKTPSGDIDTLRFREIEDGAKCMSLSSSPAEVHRPGDAPHRPSDAFLAHDARQAAKNDDTPLYVVEGELDALSIWQAGGVACGAPGASFWRSSWCDGWEDLSVILAGDGDEGGETFLETTTGALAENPRLRNSPYWLRTQCLDGRFPDGTDANELLQKHQLGEKLRFIENKLQQQKNRHTEGSHVAA